MKRDASGGLLLIGSLLPLPPIFVFPSQCPLLNIVILSILLWRSEILKRVILMPSLKMLFTQVKVDNVLPLMYSRYFSHILLFNPFRL